MSLEDLRAEVQKVDRDIIRLIYERVRLAEDIFEAKRALGVGIEDKKTGEARDEAGPRFGDGARH